GGSIRPDRVHATEHIAVAAPEVGDRHDAESDLVADREGRARAASCLRGGGDRLVLDGVVAEPALEQIRDPEREAVDDDRPVRIGATDRAAEVDGLLDERPLDGALATVTRDSRRHLLVSRLA